MRNSVRASVTYSFEFSVPSIPYMTCIHLSPEFNVRNSHREEVFRFSLSRSSVDLFAACADYDRPRNQWGTSTSVRRHVARSLARPVALSLAPTGGVVFVSACCALPPSPPPSSSRFSCGALQIFQRLYSTADVGYMSRADRKSQIRQC